MSFGPNFNENDGAALPGNARPANVEDVNDLTFKLGEMIMIKGFPFKLKEVKLHPRRLVLVPMTVAERLEHQIHSVR